MDTSIYANQLNENYSEFQNRKMKDCDQKINIHG